MQLKSKRAEPVVLVILSWKLRGEMEPDVAYRWSASDCSLVCVKKGQTTHPEGSQWWEWQPSETLQRLHTYETRPAGAEGSGHGCSWWHRHSKCPWNHSLRKRCSTLWSNQTSRQPESVHHTGSSPPASTHLCQASKGNKTATVAQTVLAHYELFSYWLGRGHVSVRLCRR